MILDFFLSYLNEMLLKKPYLIYLILITKLLLAMLEVTVVIHHHVHVVSVEHSLS